MLSNYLQLIAELSVNIQTDKNRIYQSCKNQIEAYSMKLIKRLYTEESLYNQCITRCAYLLWRTPQAV